MDLTNDSKVQPPRIEPEKQLENTAISSPIFPKDSLPDDATASQAVNSPIDANDLSDTRSFRNNAIVDDPSSAIKILPAISGGFEKDRTVISQRPVTAPNEYYKSVPLGQIASMLEGRQLDHFSVQQIIGGGGMGAVFRGIDQRLDRIVAIKVIPGSRRDVETLRRFQTEAQAAARLDHPNIARVFYVGEAEQWNYIVFEFIDGVNIRDLVEMDGPLSIDDAVFYTRQIAEALQHAHERAVVHRDIKPSNILVTPSGMAKLVDMGLARDTSLDKSTGEQTASGVTLGTFDYISPEQARNPRDADVRSDLYSLGCSLFFMLTGYPPFPEGTALQKLLNHGSLPPPDPRGWRDDISDQLYDIVMKLMAKRPTDRYQRPIELVNDLLLLAEQENLPRSQGPSTITLSPSISQPTLLETHLPWIVAAIVLLGSTLWLHSQISLATGFSFPNAIFPEAAANSETSSRQPAPATPLPTTPVLNEAPIQPTITKSSPAPELAASTATQAPILPQSANSESVESSVVNSAAPVATNTMLEPTVETSLTGDPFPAKISSLVVCTSPPVDVAPEAWESSLARALQRLVSQGGIGEIEIRGTVQLDKSVEIKGGVDVTLRGANAEARIEIGRALWNLATTSSAVRLTDSSLTLRALQIRCVGFESNAAMTVPRSIFAVVGDASLSSNNVEFTLQQEMSNSLHLLSSEEYANPTFRSNGRMESHAARITINNCMVRGDASVFRINQSSGTSTDTIQIGVTSSIVAVSGRVLDLYSNSGETGIDRIVRFLCDRSTFVSEQGFARLEYAGLGKPLTGFNRTSQACVFWSSADYPHVTVYGTNADPSSNPDQLMLQGTDNAYDQNVEHICTVVSSNARTTHKSVIEGQQSGWYGERSTERVLRWKLHPPLNSASFIDARSTDFQLVPSHFVPGFRPPQSTTP